MTTTLAFDTASPAFALALAVDGSVVRSFQRESNQDHSRLLLAAIDEITAGERAGLDGIIVVRGPGSYAGLRVGIATAEGLAIARNIPLAGVRTLDAVAHACGQRQCLAVHPAGRSEYAAQKFRDGHPTGPLTAVVAAELGPNFCGEGAGARGGVEVTPEQRCRAALELGRPLLAHTGAGEVEAIYLREPHITRPRRKRSG